MPKVVKQQSKEYLLLINHPRHLRKKASTIHDVHKYEPKLVRVTSSCKNLETQSLTHSQPKSLKVEIDGTDMAQDAIKQVSRSRKQALTFRYIGLLFFSVREFLCSARFLISSSRTFPFFPKV